MSDVLKDELTLDPLSRGYVGMTDQAAADDLNSIYPAPDTRTRNRTSLSGSEVANAIDVAEFISLTNSQEQEIWNWLHLGTLNPFGIEATRFMVIFGGGSTTIAALLAIRLESITRAQELPGVRSPVKVGHVQVARS